MTQSTVIQPPFQSLELLKCILIIFIMLSVGLSMFHWMAICTPIILLQDAEGSASAHALWRDTQEIERECLTRLKRCRVIPGHLPLHRKVHVMEMCRSARYQLDSVTSVLTEA